MHTASRRTSCSPQFHRRAVPRGIAPRYWHILTGKGSASVLHLLGLQSLITTPQSRLLNSSRAMLRNKVRLAQLRLVTYEGSSIAPDELVHGDDGPIVDSEAIWSYKRPSPVVDLHGSQISLSSRQVCSDHSLRSLPPRLCCSVVAHSNIRTAAPQRASIYAGSADQHQPTALARHLDFHGLAASFFPTQPHSASMKAMCSRG